MRRPIVYPYRSWRVHIAADIRVPKRSRNPVFDSRNRRVLVKAKLSIQEAACNNTAQHEIGVRDSRLDAAATDGNRSRFRSRIARADIKRPCTIDRCDRTAAGTPPSGSGTILRCGVAPKTYVVVMGHHGRRQPSLPSSTS